MTVKGQTQYVCEECGAMSHRWLGRCHECGSWNSFLERAAPDSRAEDGSCALNIDRRAAPVPLADVTATEGARTSTGIGEVDRVLGGGLVPGSVVLLGGEPGIGKSTLLLQVSGRIAETVGPALYASGEESLGQLKLRADRLDVRSPHLYVHAERRVDAIVEAAGHMSPAAVVVDSIQTASVDTLASSAGSVSQIRESAAAMMRYAKSSDATVFLVGHVTKEGTLAGPKVLEHMVDTVIYFEGDLQHTYRLIRATKNRYGSTNELGVFEMSDSGLAPVENPSEFFLGERYEPSSGSVVVSVLEGSRPLLLELQALVSPTRYGTAARVAPALDRDRVSLLIAVLEQRGGVSLANADVFVNVTGGVRVDEPAVDLGVLVAIASSARDVAVNARTVFVGEVGLGGEVRATNRLEQRLTEAQKLGFEHAIISARSAGEASTAGIGQDGKKRIEVVPVRHIREALEAAF